MPHLPECLHFFFFVIFLSFFLLMLHCRRKYIGHTSTESISSFSNPLLLMHRATAEDIVKAQPRRHRRSPYRHLENPETSKRAKSGQTGKQGGPEPARTRRIQSTAPYGAAVWIMSCFLSLRCSLLLSCCAMFRHVSGCSLVVLAVWMNIWPWGREHFAPKSLRACGRPPGSSSLG